MSWTDYTFDEAFLGNERGGVLHRFEVTPDVWHVCYVDGHDDYHHGFYQHRDGRFSLLPDYRISQGSNGAVSIVARKVPELGAVHANGGHPEHMPFLVEGDF